jgi:hypothetical protein
MAFTAIGFPWHFLRYFANGKLAYVRTKASWALI